jgi:hypothetical protein
MPADAGQVAGGFALGNELYGEVQPIDPGLAGKIGSERLALLHVGQFPDGSLSLDASIGGDRPSVTTCR